MTELPIACTLSAGELAGRAGELAAVLGRAAERREREDWLELRFAPVPGIVSELARVIEQERACCAFLRFRLTVEPAAGPISLELTGPPGTRDFLQSLLA